jgi:hypothetical protein
MVRAHNALMIALENEEKKTIKESTKVAEAKTPK